MTKRISSGDRYLLLFIEMARTPCMCSPEDMCRICLERRLCAEIAGEMLDKGGNDDYQSTAIAFGQEFARRLKELPNLN